MASLPRSVPSVKEKNDVSLEDVDDFEQLSDFLQMMVMLEAVSEAHGEVDMENTCSAELQLRYWALTRRNRLAAIYSARSSPNRKFELVGGNTGRPETTNLAKEGLRSVDAFRAYFASKGIPVIDAIS